MVHMISLKNLTFYLNAVIDNRWSLILSEMDDRAYWWNRTHFSVVRELTDRDGDVISPDVAALTAISIVCCFFFGRSHPLVTSTRDSLEHLCRRQRVDAPKKPLLKRQWRTSENDDCSSMDEEGDGQALDKEAKTVNPHEGQVLRLSFQRLQHAIELSSKLDLALYHSLQQPLEVLEAHGHFQALPMEWRKVFPMYRTQRTS